MYIIIFLVFAGLGYLVSARLKQKFKTYSQVPISSQLTGQEVAEKMLKDNGIYDVQVISTPGQLTDHYNPANKTVNLSEAVYRESNIASAAVAAHECGHAVQHATAYRWLQMRSKLVPIVGISSKIMNVIFLFGFLGAFAFNFPYDIILLVIIAAQAVIALFTVITLPVEYDASNRAIKWLKTSGVAGFSELDQATDALKWAARTYVVAALGAVTTLLYYVFRYMGSRD